jgi:hypothetical protein
MDWGRFGVQMIPRFTMGSAMPSALASVLAVFYMAISDLHHPLLVIQLTIEINFLGHVV